MKPSAQGQEREALSNCELLLSLSGVRVLVSPRQGQGQGLGAGGVHCHRECGSGRLRFPTTVAPVWP